MVVETIEEAKAAKIRQYPVHTNRASSMGHPCTRYLVFERTRWQDKALHDVGLQFVFDLGNMIEDLTLQDLREAGLQVIEQQRPFTWDRYQITGHIDGSLVLDDEAFPLEIKSTSPYLFEGIRDVAGMLTSKYHHLRRYPAQMCLYLLMSNKPRGLMLFRNKSTGRLREVWVDLDYELGEGLLQKAEAINAHVAAGTVPPPVEWEDNLCGTCGYLHICTPDRIGKEVETVSDEELEELCETRERNKAAHKEYKAADDILTKKLRGRDNLLIGRFWVTGKWIESTKYAYPDDIKKQYARKEREWRKDIRDMEAKP